MKDFYDADNDVEYFTALQSRINDGSIWHFEGSAGRAAYNAIESGCCVLGRQGFRDYYGNYIPSRFEVKKGTKGSALYAREHNPAIAAKTIRVK